MLTGAPVIMTHSSRPRIGAYPGSVYTSESGFPMMSGFAMMASSGLMKRQTRARPSTMASATKATVLPVPASIHLAGRAARPLGYPAEKNAGAARHLGRHNRGRQYERHDNARCVPWNSKTPRTFVRGGEVLGMIENEIAANWQVYVAIWAASAVVSYVIARGQHAATPRNWFLCGAILGPLGILLTLVRAR